MAQLAVLWATEPAAAVTHTASQDPALELAPAGNAGAHFSPAPVWPEVTNGFVRQGADRFTTAQPLQPDSGIDLYRRILAASRLLANPPPFGV
jgi:hypothetical protein